VPAEHRLLGMDRRALPFAVAVLVVWLVWAVIVPAVDNSVSYDDPIRAGDRMALTDTLVFTPAVGWDVRDGFRLDPQGRVDESGPVELETAGVLFKITPGNFAGTPAQLLAQINKVTTLTSEHESSFKVTSQKFTVSTDAGELGVAEGFTSPRAQGLIIAFVIGDTGLRIQVVGPPEQITANGDEVTAMVQSIDTMPPEGGGT
jgi:hypothetical protein